MVTLLYIRQRWRRENSYHQLAVGLKMMFAMSLCILCQMKTVAFVEVRPSFCPTAHSFVFRSLNNRNYRIGLILCRENKIKALVTAAPPNSTEDTSNVINRRRSRKNIPNKSCSAPYYAVRRKIHAFRSPAEIKDWISKQLRQQEIQNQENKASFPWRKWSVHEQVEFVKHLQKRRSFASILLFLSVFDDDNAKEYQENPLQNIQKQQNLVKVYTTALFAISSSIDQGHDNDSGLHTKTTLLQILDQMQRNHVSATTLTYVAIFKNLHGRPADVMEMMRFLEKRELQIPKSKRMSWNADVYHAAIYACRSQIRNYQTNEKIRNTSPKNSSNDWQTALSLIHCMQRRAVQPTSKTYLAILDVMAQSQAKLPVIKSIVVRWDNARVANRCDDIEEDRIWAMALNACAVVGDVCQALQFIEHMSKTCKPNLLHCTALLKSFARSKEGGRDRLATTALDAMMGNTTAVLEVHNCNKKYRVVLPRTDLDLVALNIILSIVVKVGNFDHARQLFHRIKDGEFTDANGNEIFPDRITYHNFLAGCRDPESAKRIVKEMRMSRRKRHGSIPPTSVTYAHAISVCQRAVMPDLATVNQLMNWANDDHVKPTVFMYASAIWTAQRCGDLSRCLELYEELERTGCRPNGVVLNGILAALCDEGEYSRAMEIFHLLKDLGFQVSFVALKRLVFTITKTNKMQVKEEKIESILLEILNRLDQNERKVGIGSPVFEALISIYAAWGDIDKALTVMDQINGCLDATCFRAVLFAYSNCSPSRSSEAVELLHTTIINDSPAPGRVDQIALSHVLKSCSRANEFEEGLSLLNLYGIPAKDLPEGSPQISIVALNALVAACGRGGRSDLSLSILNEMSSKYGLRPDGRSYRSAIIACNQAQHAQKADEFDIISTENGLRDLDGTVQPVVEWWECSLALYRRMIEDGLTPDAQTLSSVISSCESAGEWQRALSVLQTIIDNSKDTSSLLNMYCWNAALSACEKGGAWVEALDLYERMLESSFKPNVVTINSIMEALDKADQKELAQSIYDEGLTLGLLNPWKKTTNEDGEFITALDLHTFSEPLAKAAIRKTMDTWLDERDITGGLSGDFVIITGKGKHSASLPKLQKATKKVLMEYGIKADSDEFNRGRIVVRRCELLHCFDDKSWR